MLQEAGPRTVRRVHDHGRRGGGGPGGDHRRYVPSPLGTAEPSGPAPAAGLDEVIGVMSVLGTLERR